ncbi:hypothetical protein BG0431 [Borreliella bavariensis PBi]|uniref:Uncharacterized protein n=1 Tax=Borrelia garinii subsp. bavariensis (strain ATCC BAA-2496 / DSM 23469 / PBi) TaxID=290434 RepID=A0A7I6GW91_BORGP|nr:hypothetical protein BG0431 [Borreliella bavariensis PBi]
MSPDHHGPYVLGNTYYNGLCKAELNSDAKQGA